MQYEKEVFSLYQAKTGRRPVRAERLGGGYYADVYRMYTENGACPDVVKIYKTKGMMAQECASLAVLREHAIFPMPQVLWTQTAEEGCPLDVMAMEYLAGQNGGGVRYFSKRKREKLAKQVTDNLLAWHSTVNPSGFGALDAKEFTPVWQTYYFEKAQGIFKTAQDLHNGGRFPSDALQTMCTALERFDSLFSQPITQASLIHGDYNMWNVLVDKKACAVTAVIDPCNCMWADSEMDLYQLNNANGRHLGLLEAYARKRPLSENFGAKCAFYELFTETEHYYHSGHSVDKMRVQMQTDALKKYL